MHNCKSVGTVDHTEAIHKNHHISNAILYPSRFNVLKNEKYFHGLKSPVSLAMALGQSSRGQSADDVGVLHL